MPDPYLVGNGAWCSCCFPKGRPDTSRLPTASAWRKRVRPGCNECAGAGRIAFTAEAIVAATIPAKRKAREYA